MTNSDPSKEDLEKAYLMLSRVHSETMLELIQTQQMMDEMSGRWWRMLKHRIKWRFNIASRFNKENSND
jgi:hypothetical protein